MARLQGIAAKDAGILTRIAYFFARKKVGRLPEPIRVYAHNPWVLRAYGAFELGAERAQTVDKRLKTLASIKAGTLVGCPW